MASRPPRDAAGEDIEMELMQPPPQSWSAVWLAQARAHPITAAGFGIALLAVLGLLIASLSQTITGEEKAAFRFALLGGLAGFAATALGAAPGVLLHGIPTRVEDSMLGLAAAIALQDIPEGLAVALALRSAGLAALRAVLIGAPPPACLNPSVPCWASVSPAASPPPIPSAWAWRPAR
jgi:ZIP family zinc transporter